MATKSSREFALERRKALSDSGKKASQFNASSPNRIRSSADAPVSRTDRSFHNKQQTKSSISTKGRPYSNHSSTSTTQMTSLHSRQIKAISRPSRELVLARREALSRRGKSADTSTDRTRVDVAKKSSESKASDVQTSSNSSFQEANNKKASKGNSSVNSFSTQPVKYLAGDRRVVQKRRSIANPSRALVLARREALSKHGKSASKLPTSAASVARQGNPDLSSREISQRVRELRSKSGATGKNRSCGSRPCGPNKNGSKINAAVADAHWKVGSSQTSSGQLVTGTQANRSIKTTGNESSTCRSITGTQYLGIETINTFCNDSPSYVHPSKVSVTNTTHGNFVTGNEVGRSEKVTGDEPGTCKNLTGTEYISANQLNDYCGSSQPSPRKIGHSTTEEGRKVSGVMVGRSHNVTGDEAGSERQLTGDQYLGSDPLPEGRPAEKVGKFNTLRGAGVTGTSVARSTSVTGNEPGSCKRVTGDEYVGQQEQQTFCGGKQSPEASKVGLSLTNKAQGVSGTLTGRSELVTGDEPGTCKAVTGTPYAGLEQASTWCDSKSVDSIKERTPKNLGTPGSRMTGIQPGLGGPMTGADKGACETLTGTPYVGGDHLIDACGVNAPLGSDHTSNENGSPWNSFSVESPARTAHMDRTQNSAVTGTSYENSSKITGPFDMADDKITGTEQFRFDKKQKQLKAIPVKTESTSEDQSRPTSRITGEGQSAGLNITGDDWDRGERVTGTEGVSARRRNPSRPGGMTAMPSYDLKRNEELAKPDFLITGSSGNTRDGQLVTFSGGARG